MDKYTKFILTVIAIGVLGLNFHLFKSEMISPVNAANIVPGDWGSVEG